MTACLQQLSLPLVPLTTGAIPDTSIFSFQNTNRDCSNGRNGCMGDETGNNVLIAPIVVNLVMFVNDVILFMVAL